MYFAYILQSEKDQRYYFGYTTNMIERLKEHNQGCSMHTSKYRPWRLIWYGAFIHEDGARAFEKYLKSGSGYAFSRKRLM